RASAIRSAPSSPTSSPAVRYWIGPDRDITAFRPDIPAPACLCRPRPLVPARTTAENRGFSTEKGEFPRETGLHLTCMGVFLSSGFWFVAGSLFGAEKPFLVPPPALRFAERAEGVKGPKC